ncbi:MAG: hypothetical protein CSA70_09105 [Rhodobacterales bacterium]|nr:MAG: hypothetical protein CSA70_09105 [Rhodobacterales bacterium]
MWLDRGELDKIIEQATEPMVLPNPDSGPEPIPRAPESHIWQDPCRKDGKTRDKRYRGKYSDDDHKRYKKRKRRKFFLEEIFDRRLIGPVQTRSSSGGPFHLLTRWGRMGQINSELSPCVSCLLLPALPCPRLSWFRPRLPKPG